MRRALLLSVAIALVAAACSNSEPSQAAAAEVPTEAVARWFEAVENGDVDEAAATTVDGALAIVLALENDMDSSEMSSLVVDGVPEDLAGAYWASFRQEFADFAGRPISTLRVGGYREFEAQGVDYAAVTIIGRSDTEGTVYTRLEDEGGWAVDLLATVGSGFVGVMQRSYESIPEGEEGDAAREAFRELAAPSLWAILASGGADDGFTREAFGFLELIGA